MIDAKRLLSDCQALVRELEVDLRDELDQRPNLQALLNREHHEATVAKRTRRSAEDWTAERVTQAAVAWVLGCVFVRFLEDNALVETPRLSGTGVRLQRAREEQTLYFRQYPERTAREYLEDTFRGVAALPGCSGLFDERHNAIWQLPISGDAARTLLERWREIDPQTGELVHDFTDPAWGTRFLGDLYQDLSEAARKQYALLQTPEFVEEFILERTLEPAIDEFGLGAVRLIDPACGSGHFLLGAFARLLSRWRELEPGRDTRSHVQRVLAAVAGVDLNPFAAAIARFRLLVAALRACDVSALSNAPDFQVDIGVGDSLLHTPRASRLDIGRAEIRKGFEHVYATEDSEAVRRLLGRQYHAVVANPPYVTPKDAALRTAYRDRFSSCYREFPLTVPFMELMFDLAVPPSRTSGGGHVGQITANSFMKREFGKKLIEEFLPTVDLTHLIDTSGAYIPGHATPTVVLIGRNRSPVGGSVRAVMGIRGEPSVPADPAQGKVWTALTAIVDLPAAENEYASVSDISRHVLAKHPWSLGGGGASELRERIEEGAKPLTEVAAAIGFGAITGSDDVFVRGAEPTAQTVEIVDGDRLRDWSLREPALAIWPYDTDYKLRPLPDIPEIERLLWPYRETLLDRKRFGTPMRDLNRPWYEWRELYPEKLRGALRVAYAFVSTHNHFFLDRGGRVYNKTAPVIQLPDAYDEPSAIALVGVLNSSLACFWLKQMCQSKGVGGIGGGIGDEAWEPRFEFDSTKMSRFPLRGAMPLTRAQELHSLAQESSPDRSHQEALRRRMIAAQEELDWEVYNAYGLVADDVVMGSGDVPPVQLGERAFEIVLARRLASGEVQTTWYERHGSAPVTEVPEHWPESYRTIVERRIHLIESDRTMSLIETPEYKRRWQWESWEKQQERALREWLLNRLEDQRYWQVQELTSCARLADEARKDAEFRSAAERYAGRPDVDLAKLVERLVVDKAVPYLAAWRYSADGMRVRAAWERTWELQRREDAIDSLCALPDDEPQRLTPEQAKVRKQFEVGQIPLPPKFTSKHFRKGTYWQLRGKLDVPKERFILYPGCERAADSSPVIGWAGWDHLERSQALAQYVTRMRQEERWEADRLTPLLAGLAEQLPWVIQWHNEFDPSLGRRVGDAYADFLSGQLAELGLSPEDIAAWRPPEATRGRRARKVAV